MSEAKENNCFLNAETNKRGESSPDFWGYMTLSRDLVVTMANAIKSGETPSLRIAAWKKKNSYGTYLSLSVKPDDPKSRISNKAPPKQNPPETRGRKDALEELDDEIPF